MRTDFSPTAASARDFYRLLTAVVVPRPIAWVSSVSPEGVDNLAPRSFFTVASTNPPIVQGLHGYGRRTLNLRMVKPFVRPQQTRCGSGKLPALADADGALELNVREPPSFQSFLLHRRGDPSALGPRIEMVAMLCGTGTATAEAGLRLALTARPGHPFPALLAGKPADGIPAPYIPGLHH